MKPLLLVPPAQAEALSDAQEYETPEQAFLEYALPGRRPWRDDENPEETLVAESSGSDRGSKILVPGTLRAA